MKAKFISFRPLFPSNSKKKTRSYISRFKSSSMSSSSLSSPSSSEGKETPKSVIPHLSLGSSTCDWSHSYDDDSLELFKLFDRDGDGKISLHELEHLFHRLGVEPPTQDELLLMLDEADRDGDGCISFQEFGALSVAMGPAEGEDLRAAFEYFDRDGDGRISADELLRVFVALGDERCTLEECRRMIDGVDADEKGFVCFEDFARMMTRGRYWK